VFVAQGYAPLNGSITLDGGPSALLMLSQPTDIMYHVPFYAIQALPLTQHILEIRLNSWDDRSATSYLLLDYVGVAYNDEVPSPTTTSSSTSSSESQSIMPSSSKNTRDVVGIAVGCAVMGMIIVSTVIVFLRKRRTNLFAEPGNVDARYSTFNMH